MTKTYGLDLRPSHDVFIHYRCNSVCLYDRSSMRTTLHSIITQVYTLVESQIIPPFFISFIMMIRKVQSVDKEQVS